VKVPAAGAALPPAVTDDPIFAGLFDKKLKAIPEDGLKRRFNISLAVEDSKAGRWVEQPRLPIPVSEMGVIECNGRIHVVGGYARQRTDGDFHQIYDPATKQWSLGAPLPFGCNHIALATIGDKIYGFGGFIEQNRAPHSRTFVYDTKANEWTTLKQMPRPRGAASAVVLDGKVHVIGGRDVRSVEWHEVYDPATQGWEVRAPMIGSTKTQPHSGQRDHMAVALVDGNIHAIGGRMDSYDFNTGLHTVYDVKTDKWTNRAPMPTPRSGPSGVFYAGKIFVFGGEATGRVFGTNECYDPKTDSWAACTPMAVPRHGLHGATAALIGDMVHVPGGGVVPGGSIQGAYHDAFTLG
jgi:N-acetylneuraminic acid mutarotase